MEWIVNWIRDNTTWLYTKIYENPFFFFDYWSFVHIYSGIGIFIFFTFLGIKRRWMVLSIILISYEIFEISLLFFAVHLFLPETFKDQFTDIVLGIFGGFVGQYLLKEKNLSASFILNHRLYQDIAALYTAFTIAFVWVGNYQYQYNQQFFNSPGLNWWAFFLWFVGLETYFEAYLFLKGIIKNFYLLLTISWLSYFTALLVFEFIGFYILNIHNISHGVNTSLIFGLVHGTTVMHIFYLSVPIISIAIFETFDKIFFTARQKESLRGT